MKSDREVTEPPQFLSGWKEIANYLGKGVRTVQRYERDLGLPVRRPARRARGSVVITRAEVDAWVAASPIRDAFRLSGPMPQIASLAKTMRAGIEEMRRLGEQMAILRCELGDSVEQLRQSVNALYEEGPLRTRTVWPRSLALGNNSLDLIDSYITPPQTTTKPFRYE